MKPFENFRGLVACLERANIDTDQIIPKQFLKSIARTGFGESLFFDWRYLADGKPNPDFSLNQSRFRGASILVAGNNFGCGSSREHAVWAIVQYGFRAVIAPRTERDGTRIPAFADIFRNNAGKNGLLTVELPEVEVEEIFHAIQNNPGLQATVDLSSEKVIVHAKTDRIFTFFMDPAVKERLLKGLDDIGMTLEQEANIRSFENRHNAQLSRP